MDQQEILAKLKDTGALLEGHFELRSGLHSDRYFQCANLLMYPRTAGELCGALSEQLRRVLPADPPVDAVVSPAMGGIIVGHEIARALGVRSIFVEKTQDGALALRRFEISGGESFVVAEDVITRGGRVQETIDIVEGRGGKIAAIALLIDRSDGAVQFEYPTSRLLEMAPVAWEPGDCPLCAEGVPLVHPGS